MFLALFANLYPRFGLHFKTGKFKLLHQSSVVNLKLSSGFSKSENRCQ